MTLITPRLYRRGIYPGKVSTKDTLREGWRSMGCPDANTIISFVDGQLDEADRSGVAIHLASCELCLSIVAAAIG